MVQRTIRHHDFRRQENILPQLSQLSIITNKRKGSLVHEMIFSSILPSVTKSHVERKLLNTHPMHLFRIIQDVDRYAEFLPLCSYSKINKKLTNGFEATLTVGLPPLFSETYRSKVTVNPRDLIVETQSFQGKYFDRLTSRWKLSPVKSSDESQFCNVDFHVEITASDPVVVSTLDSVLEKIAGDQVNAFERRCRQIPMADDLRVLTQ